MQLLQTMEDDALDDSGAAETASASTASASGLPDKERAAGRSRSDGKAYLTGVAIVADVLHVFCVFVQEQNTLVRANVSSTAALLAILLVLLKNKKCNRPYIPLHPGLGGHQHGKSPAARLKLQHRSP